MVRTVAAARKAVSDEPKRWRAALCEDTQRPQSDNAQVKLFATKKGAHDALRDRSNELVAAGWKRSYGTLARGHLVLERGTDLTCLCIDTRRK